MLDREIKQAYQKIAPSSELEQKILDLKVQPSVSQKRARMLKPIMAMAASLVLLLGGVSVVARQYQAGMPEIILQNGLEPNRREKAFSPETVEYAAVAPRTAAVAPASHASVQEGKAIDFTMTLQKEVFLEVNAGTIYMISNDEDGNVAADLGQSTTTEAREGEIRIRWIIPMSDEDAEYEMKIGEKEIIRVTYLAQTDAYFITRESAEY